MRDFLKKNSLFLLIVALAIALRLVIIEKVPPALNWDEISHGYNAYSILKTGRDEWGVSLPAIFRAYGDYKLPVYIYLTAVSELIFGLSAFSVRLPSILAGIITVIVSYLLVKKLFNEKAALLSSFLVAIEPWSLFLSRGAFEANLALSFIVSGIYLFILGLEKYKYLPISALLLGLSVWTYNSARIFVPLFLVVLLALYWQELIKIWEKNRRPIVFSLALTLLFLVPMLLQLLSPVGRARYGKVSIIDEGAVVQINEKRASSIYPPILSRLIYNKATFFTKSFIRNYLSHFSFGFLFTKGGTHYQFSVPGHGLIYTINILFFVLGLYHLLTNRTRESFLLLIWFLLSPIPSSLTREAPHALRAITMLPIPMIVSALGFFYFLEKTEKLKVSRGTLTPVYLILLIVFAENYFKTYFLDYRRSYSWAWQYGYKEVVDYAKENYIGYDKIIVTKKYGEPHEFFLFYWSWDPDKYRDDPNLIRFHQSDWYWVDRFDKFYFVNDWEIPKIEGGRWKIESGEEIPVSNKSLLITSPSNYPPGWVLLKTIGFLDGKPAFDILEKN
ncbi:glycosyltransferase family 39 protein [Candidatus Woesebacteria bacterium]|nr:glycosyltransferase family 39 protein [Candidatus Woesebacteria bacterium]